MAYATLAGVPPVTGLYATLVPLLVYFLLGPSRILVLGPDSAVCPLVAAAIVPLAAHDAGERIALAGMLAIGVGVLVTIAGLRFVSRRAPGVLIGVVGATAVVAIFGLDVPIVGAVPAGLPAIGPPDASLSDLKSLLPAAVGIAFVAFADTSVLSRSYASRLDQDVDQNRE